MTLQLKGILLTMMGVLFVVPDSLFVRLITADAFSIAFWRLLCSGVLIALGLLMWRGLAPFRAVLRTGWVGMVYGFGTGGSGVMFVLAVEHTSVANVVFILAAMPVFAMIFSRVFLREPITRRMLLTILSVALGLAVVAYGSGETETGHWTGDLMALSVSMMFAAALTAARQLRDTSMVAAVPISFCAVALLIMPVAAPFSIVATEIPIVALHGVFIAVSSIFLALGPRYITSAEVSLLVLIESICAPLLVWGVLGENPGVWALLGGVIVLGALFVSNAVVLLRNRRRAS